MNLLSLLLLVLFLIAYTSLAFQSISRIHHHDKSATYSTLYNVNPNTHNDIYKVKAVRSISKISTILSISLGLRQQAANAKTYFDTDVYGDKELKIATLNKIKQKLRNAIVEDPSLAPQLLELAICDAIGYNIQDEDGGPDGSIQYEVDREEFKNLKPAVSVIEKIKNELKRTNTVGFADLVAFGGGEALESCGCPRTTVQIGRFDSKAANKKIFNFNTDPVSAFYTAGLDPKDVAVMLIALGEVKRISQETVQYRSTKKDSDEDDEDDDNWQGNVPSTFGRRDEIYGKKLEINDFGSKFVSNVLKGKSDSKLASSILEDPKVKAAAQKYTSNDKAFKEDVVATYLKLTNLGESYNDLRRGG